MNINLKINEILQELDKTPYWLAKNSGVTNKTIYNLVDDDGVSSINFSTLSAIIKAIEKEKREQTNIGDYLSIERE